MEIVNGVIGFVFGVAFGGLAAHVYLSVTGKIK